MALKRSGAGELTEIDRYEGGVGWITYPDESMERASHAVESEGDLWIIDPVNADGLDELLEGYADPAGVVVLLDRHRRDSEAVATRHDVPVYVPEWMSGVASEIDAPTERFEDQLAGFSAIRLIDNPLWQEAVLFDGETLVVPEALGTAEYFHTADEELGVHPMLRLLPPRQLRDYDPERLLVGHGVGVSENVGAAVRRAIENSRRNAPRLYAKAVGELLGVR